MREVERKGRGGRTFVCRTSETSSSHDMTTPAMKQARKVLVSRRVIAPMTAPGKNGEHDQHLNPASRLD